MDAEEAPETSDEFERLVVAQPNVSFVWVKYMAFLISLGDIPAARAVVERALKTINYRQGLRLVPYGLALGLGEDSPCFAALQRQSLPQSLPAAPGRQCGCVLHPLSTGRSAAVTCPV